MFCRALIVCWALLASFAITPAAAQDAPPGFTLTQALAVESEALRFPADGTATPITLPDDWAQSRPRYDGSVWYRVRFDLPVGETGAELMALYIERVCTNVEVLLNGERIFSGGRMLEPLTRNCHRPQLITLPPALLEAQGNVLDLRVVGASLWHVAARQRAGGLSALQIGPLSELAPVHAAQHFWNVGTVQIAALTLMVFGLFMLGLYRTNRSEVYLGYFGALLVCWSLLSVRVWWPDIALDAATVEFLVCTAFPVTVAFAVQFLLSYAGLRSRMIETALLAQCVLMPLGLLIAGPSRVFPTASAWFVLLAIEVIAAVALYLVFTWRGRRQDFWPMFFILGGTLVLVLIEMAMQHQMIVPARLDMLNVAVPLMFLAVGARLLQLFAHALEAAEAGRRTLETRVKQATAEIERTFAEMAEMRVEQVTQNERKRIAADLHDDLGAKLLTIVHTSESERISTLAREALEEMRLSVRGLSGRPVRLGDALADWRAETVSRLGQANIEAEWRGPAEEIEQLLPARTFVQTTRVLREAVSNIIKHSGASHCTVSAHVSAREFGVTVQDNGGGIPHEPAGRLDRGHGMASMKHRAKQLQGQCLVESAPGYGTVIRLTLPL